MTRKKRKHHGSTLDAFLKDEGVLEKFEAIATKEVIAWQFAQAKKMRRLSKPKTAQLRRRAAYSLIVFSIPRVETLRSPRSCVSGVHSEKRFQSNCEGRC